MMCKRCGGDREESCRCAAVTPCDEAPEVEVPSGNEREARAADPLAGKPERDLEGFGIGGEANDGLSG